MLNLVCSIPEHAGAKTQEANDVVNLAPSKSCFRLL